MKTHIIRGSQDVISQGLVSPVGTSSQAVSHLKWAMGGGKIHPRLGFRLPARPPELPKIYCAGRPRVKDCKSVAGGALEPAPLLLWTADEIGWS